MTWATEQRQRFIGARLVEIGHLRRADLCSAFGISTPQASIDIQNFLRSNPDAASYNRTSKRYERAENWMNGTFHCPICMRDSPHVHNMTGRWIGVDFDGTLAVDRFGRTDPYELGQPIATMVLRIRGWLAAGYEVRLMTARMGEFSHTSRLPRDVKRMRLLLQDWCREHIGTSLECTNVKDGKMEVLWDDRAVRVIRDSGEPAEFGRALSANTGTKP